MSDTVKRIKSICEEFDSRIETVGVAISRLELAKALAENEEQLAAMEADRDDWKTGYNQQAEFLDYIASWHNVWKEDAEKFYRATAPDEAAYKWAQNGLKRVVKANLIK